MQRIPSASWRRPLGALAAVVCGVVYAGVAYGQAGDRPPRRGPPPEAYEACADASEGDSCAVQTPRGDTMEGTCVADRRDADRLVCRPDQPPGPPPEAFESCADADEGDRCTMQTPNGDTLEGTCAAGRDDDGLHCRPARPPGAPPDDEAA